MAGCGRNDTCTCGSGRKAKRCCGIKRGPKPADLARAYLAERRRPAALTLRKLSDVEIDDLYEEMIDLPAVDVSMHLELPRLLSPALEALRAAIEDECDGEDSVRVDLERLATPVLAELDRPERRAQLARAALALADNGRIDPKVAAAAVIDLNAKWSALMRASLVQALAVSAGAAPTPAGLLVVSL